jgi:AraC family transcriptional regulator
MQFYFPENLLAGFHAYRVAAEVPELHHVGEQWASKEYPVELNPKNHWFFLELNGESRWEALNKTYTVHPGNCIVMSPEIHYQLLDRGRSKHHFFFAAIELNPVLERLPYLKPAWQNQAVTLLNEAQSLMLPFRQLVREVTLELPYRGAGLRFAVDYLILEITRLIEKQNQELTKDSSRVLLRPVVLKAKQLLDTQPEKNWKLAELAEVTGVSSQYLVKCFTQEVGLSPHQYLLQVRVTRAGEMLSHTDIPITQLAHELGFSSSQYFANVYKRFTGKTAQAYRASLRRPQSEDFKQISPK